MADDKNLGIVKLAKVRLSYPHLFKPAPVSKSEPDKLKYQASFIFPKDDVKKKKALEKAYEEVCMAKWGEVKKFKGNKYPIRDGDEENDNGESKGQEYEGMFHVNARSEKRPVVKDGSKQTIDEDNGTVYGGCYVNAIVRLYAVDGENRGVYVSLEGVMFAGHGERFGAPPISDEEFDDFEDADEDF